jgi:nucleoid DNA-binding protein
MVRSSSSEMNIFSRKERHMATLGKSDIVKLLSEKLETTQKQAEEYLQAFLTLVEEAMHNGDDIRLIGFGSFSVQDVAAREGVNPQTREPIHIPAGKRVKFSAGKNLQDAVTPPPPPVPEPAKSKSKGKK